MENDREKQIEQLIHRELRQLPELRAPETLVHRVMLAVHARTRQPWWQRPWLTWPRSMQVTSSAVCIAAAAALVYFGAAAWQSAGIGNPLDKFWQWASSLSVVWDWFMTLINAAALVLQKAGQQYLLIALSVAVTMYLMCVAAGTMCYRLVFNRR
jgi:hypothetical protein